MIFDSIPVFTQFAALALSFFAGLIESRPGNVQDIRLTTGVRLRVTSQGPQDAPVMLMLHGYSDSGFSFSRVLPLLPDNVRVIVPDQRGHGDSERPEHGYTIDDFADDAVALMDALHVPRATIVGHSMGSFVARRVAEKAPERVTRLILLSGAPSARNSVLTDLAADVQALSDPVDPAFVRDFQLSTVHRVIPEDFLARAIVESRRVPVRVWKATIAGLLAFSPSVNPLACPTLVLGGDKDAVFARPEQEALAASIPGASVHIVPGIGHALHWEAPEEFVALIGDRKARRRRPSGAIYTAPVNATPARARASLPGA